MFFVCISQNSLSWRSGRCYLFNIFFFLLDLCLVFGQHVNHEVLTHPEVVWALPWKNWACCQNTDLQSESARCDSLYTAVEMARDLKSKSIKTGTSNCCESVLFKVMFYTSGLLLPHSWTFYISKNDGDLSAFLWQIEQCARDRVCIPMDTVHPCVPITHCCNVSTLFLRKSIFEIKAGR